MKEYNIGDTIKGAEIGKYGIYIWVACPFCGRERWVRRTDFVKHHGRCARCAGKQCYKPCTRDASKQPHKSRPWHSHSFKTKRGYIITRLPPDSPWLSMCQGHKLQILEHRLIMAKHLNRILLKTELVHHRNGIKDDNRIENLELMPDMAKHSGKYLGCSHCILRKEIRLFKWQIKELEQQIRLLTQHWMDVK